MKSEYITFTGETFLNYNTKTFYKIKILKYNFIKIIHSNIYGAYFAD